MRPTRVKCWFARCGLNWTGECTERGRVPGGGGGKARGRCFITGAKR